MCGVGALRCACTLLRIVRDAAGEQPVVCRDHWNTSLSSRVLYRGFLRFGIRLYHTRSADASCRFCCAPELTLRQD